MRTSTAHLFEHYYYNRDDFVDGTTRFHDVCRTHIPSGASILEIGAGPTNRTSQFLSSLGDLVGADPSEEVLENTALKSAHVFERRLPFPNGTFDACVSNFVLEHVDDPTTHFSEVKRVLRPGGVYVFRTPNLLHYVAFAAWLLPHSMHVRFANRLRRLPESSHDPWPTVYRANTLPRIQKLARATGLTIRFAEMIEKEPSYGAVHAFAFYPMMAYERLVNAWDGLGRLRANIIAALQKDV